MEHQKGPCGLVLLAWLLLAGVVCADAGKETTVPVEYFSRLPFVDAVQLSPSGKHLAYLTHVDGVPFLVTQTIGAGQAKPILTSADQKEKISWFRWANDDVLLVSGEFTGLRGGRFLVASAETRLLGVRRDGSGLQHYFHPIENPRHQAQLQDSVISLLPGDPKHVMVAIDAERANFPGVYKLNVETGAMRKIHEYREPIRGWMADQQDRIRIGLGYEDGVESALVRDLESGKWKRLWSYETHKEPPRAVLGFGLDPNTLFVRELHEGRNAIFTVDLADPAFPRELAVWNKGYDIDGPLIHSPVSRQAVGVYRSGEGGARIYWTEEHKAFQKMIDEALPETTNLLQGFSADERRYTVLATSHVHPGAYYHGDRDEGTLQRFASRYPELDDLSVSGKEPIRYTASDGIEIEGYLTRPWGDDPQPWPTVVLPHGGPMARDWAGFDWLTEFLASRGYAVLQMNFRGSAGYGWDFASAAFGDYGGRMQDDVSDGARWLVGRKIADPRRLCIMGASYGGYAALWGAVKTPELFRCAISLNGVSDWGRVLAESRAYVTATSLREQLGKRGDLKQASPLRRAAEIRIPVLLVHGEDDRVVPVEHSRKMARALEKLNKAHRYVELEHGDHGLTNERNRTILLREVESFLAGHLAPPP